jgi:SNF2 family DNA or RNA helicase
MSVRIERKGRRIELRTDERIRRLQLTIPGAYETVAGYWTVPLDMATCKLLRQAFGNRLEVGTELQRWAVGTTQNRKSMAALAAAHTAELDVLPNAAPKLYKAMQSRGYQLSGVRFVADNTATLIADDPGLGKTLIAMGGILEAEVPGPYLVVAPTTASDTVWAREIKRWLPRYHTAVTLPKARVQRERVLRGIQYGPRTWLIIHPEMCMTQAYVICKEKDCGKRHIDKGRNQRQLPCGHMRAGNTVKELVHSYPDLFTQEWGALIVDECHESLIKRGGSLTQRRRGLEVLSLRESDGKRIALSGTPCDSKPHQLWGILNWLYPKQYSAFGRWAEMYWERGGYNGYELGAFRKEREPLLWSSLTDIALRRTKAEVAKDLPPKTYVGTPLDDTVDSPIGIWLPMDGKQERAYREIEKYSSTELDSGRLEAFTALGELTRLKQLASSYGGIRHSVKNGMPWYHYDPIPPSNKLTWIIDSLEEWGYPANPITKVVVVSFYTGILRAFAQAIDTHFKRKICMGITGKTPRHLRKQYIDVFNNETHPLVMMLNVRAGGTAITLDSADRMIFVSETANPDQQAQAEDRIHRVSNPRKCMYYYLRSLGTVDVGTAIANREADAATRRLLDTRRGVEYVRHILDLSHS